MRRLIEALCSPPDPERKIDRKTTMRVIERRLAAGPRVGRVDKKTSSRRDNRGEIDLRRVLSLLTSLTDGQGLIPDSDSEDEKTRAEKKLKARPSNAKRRSESTRGGGKPAAAGANGCML